MILSMRVLGIFSGSFPPCGLVPTKTNLDSEFPTTHSTSSGEQVWYTPTATPFNIWDAAYRRNHSGRLYEYMLNLSCFSYPIACNDLAMARVFSKTSDPSIGIPLPFLSSDGLAFSGGHRWHVAVLFCILKQVLGCYHAIA